METYELLLTYNIKPSVQRIAIMDFLLTHRTHPSAEAVYANLSETMPTLSKTTVYNTLKLLSENGAALMLTIDEEKICYDGDTSPHTHFLCKDCGKIYDLPINTPTHIETEINASGHRITEIHSYYRGICKNCLTK